ncbi:dihydropteroate synthase [Verrucomicrobiales bacterium]|jgi:dihydropteroate synthase|nr:dihydropteroate synthase [Verrucomicrobiales bacterium]MDB3941090.1 dihydropteroate synthase [Verrucomicrobiales bacterium]
MKWRCRAHTFDLSVRGEIMGILNVTPDSFSDGGNYNTIDAAVNQAEKMLSDGAAILDIGGESTRPGADEVSTKDETERTIPVIEAIRKRHADACISIDTSKPEVALAAIQAGAAIINDVTGFRDPAMINVAAETNAGCVVMHMLGNPRTMQADPTYDNVVTEIGAFFEERLATLNAAGVDKESIVFDPGIGFGKTLKHNLELLRHPDRIIVGERPLLLGISRKSLLGTLTGTDQANERDWSTVAVTSLTRELGIPLHRVHDVKANVEALRMIEAML